ncbi:MAG: pirin family protein [Armatimonadetes bacterium]|nr:pirin family protein [Armatimonadota bacterium]
MSQRRAAILFSPTSIDEAKGVTINRVIGGERMAILDPIMLLDHASIGPESDVVGFPRHPHRGIETVSYVITGEVGHKDSIGNEGIVGPGGTQWMTAGNGIYHEEMMKPGNEGAEMLQLWFSLPRDQKRIPPAYHGGPAASVPQIVEGGKTVRIVAGSYANTSGMFDGIAAKPTILDVQLEPNAEFEIPTEVNAATFAYVIRGSVTTDGKAASAPKVVVFSSGEKVVIQAGPNGARLFFVSAMPLDEPILQYRSFVMNSVDDIDETLEMIHAGTFAR